jgi:hypothetical protein
MTRMPKSRTHLAESENMILTLLIELRVELKHCFELLDARFNEADGRFQNIDRRLQRLEQDIDQIEQAAFRESVLRRHGLDNIDEKLDNFEKRLGELERCPSGSPYPAPSPLEGEGWGGGCSRTPRAPSTPLPVPPPQGGRERWSRSSRYDRECR